MRRTWSARVVLALLQEEATAPAFASALVDSDLETLLKTLEVIHNCFGPDAWPPSKQPLPKDKLLCIEARIAALGGNPLDWKHRERECKTCPACGGTDVGHNGTMCVVPTRKTCRSCGHGFRFYRDGEDLSGWPDAMWELQELADEEQA
ncbi:MAG: hypothetical protein ACYCW6_17840 [Candidatus Xenobia bacterium]